MDQKSYVRFCRSYYSFRFLLDFVFLYAVHLMLFELKGMSVFQISLLLIIWSSTTLVLEIPAGIISDQWNRKHMLLTAVLFKLVGFTCWYFADSFWMFALGFFFWGLEETFTSGTQEALLYDTLSKAEKTSDYARVAGRGNFFANLGIGIAVFIGAILASYSFPLTISLSIACIGLALIPVFNFHDHREVKEDEPGKSTITQFKIAIQEFKVNKEIRNMAIFGMIPVAIAGILDEYWQLYLDWVNLPLVYFGVAALLVTGLESLGGNFAHVFNEKFPSKKNIYLLTILGGICLLLSVIQNHLLALIPFMLLFFLIEIGDVIAEERIQKAIKSKFRATVFSINSFFISFSSIILMFGFGIASEYGSLVYGIVLYGILLIIYGIFNVIISKKVGK